MDLKEIGCKSVNWIQLAQDPVTGLGEHGNQPSGPIKGGEFID
jgi:hypothetical protein